MIPAKPFYLVRHGESEANAAGLTAGGGTDSPLTARGQDQAQALSRFVHKLDIKPTKIIHSPMVRARDTANFINSSLELLMHEVEDLREHKVGEWEGQPWVDVMPDLVSNVRPAGGENRDDFSGRVKMALNEVLDSHEDPVMIVAHGGIFYAISHMHSHSLDSGIDNCHLHYFEPYPEYRPFPWKVWQFDIEEERLMRCTAPFCGSHGLKTAV